MFNSFVFFDLLNEFFVLNFDMIELLGLLGEFLLQCFERIHELFNLVFGVVVLRVFAFEKVVGFFQVFDQNAMIVIKVTLWFFRYL
jgi:hypothetical protein